MFPLRMKISSIQRLACDLFCLPGHHKCSKVGDLKLLLYVDCDIDAKANERKQEPGGNKREPQPSEVACESKHQKHHCSGDIRRNRVEISLDGSKSQSANDLRQEKLDGLQRNTQAYLNA